MIEIIQRIKKHYLPMIFLILLTGFIFYLAKGNRKAIPFITWSSGYISIIILSISLIIGPVNLLLKYKNPISTYFRRDVSIIGGTLAIVHSIFGIFVHFGGKIWPYFLKKTETGYSIRLDNFGLANNIGLFSTLIIVLLLITSNDYLLKKMKPDNWKNIQRLSYLMFILTIIHCYYYRIVAKNLDLLYFLYIPLVIIVLTFQMIGVWSKLSIYKEKKI